MNSETLAGYVKKFKDQKILVVGDAMLDHYVVGKVERLNPEAPVPVLHVQEEKDATGGAGNVAKNVAALGASAVLITVVGNDDEAQRLKRLAEIEGYEFMGVVDADRPTVCKSRYMVGNQQLLRVDYEETHDVSGTVEEEIIARIKEEASRVTAIIISDYAKGVLTPAVAQAVLDVAKEKGIMVAADVKPSKARLVIGASFISPNLKEGYEFLGVNPLEHGQLEPAEVATQLHDKMKTDVYLTLGAGGVYVKTADGAEEHVSQEHVAQVFDVSGAGDTFIVTVLLSLLSGASPQESAFIGNAAGAIVVGKVGSVGVTSAELLSMADHHHE